MAARKAVKATIFFSYTSNMISSGNREVIRFLVQHKMVDVIVTTGGGIEEDFLKCFQPHYMGDFSLKGSTLRKQGLNRIGNLIVPNKNYCLFEDWFAPLLNKMHDEQETDVRRRAATSRSYGTPPARCSRVSFASLSPSRALCGRRRR